MVGMWEFATLSPRVRGKMETLPWWTLPDDHDVIKDTLQDLYYTKFIVSKLSTTLGISIDDWLKKPRYQCDRDIAIVDRCNAARNKALDDSLNEEDLP